MTTQKSSRLSAFGGTFFAFLVICFLSGAAQSQTYQVIHAFDRQDGSYPHAGLTLDRGGALYGTTFGLTNGDNNGSVFKMTNQSSGWVLTRLLEFQGGLDGAGPIARVVFGPDGALYGTTVAGGGGACQYQDFYTGCGTVFRLVPPAHPCHSISCPWTEKVLYRFAGGDDGAFPSGQLAFDSAGDIYGTTQWGGTGCASRECGTVYKLTRSGSGWTESIIYAFTGGPDGDGPYGGVTFDTSGNLYGTTQYAPYGGTVFELSPSGQGWTENTIYTFPSDFNTGGGPIGGVIFDSAGNLYGCTTYGGPFPTRGGTAFELSSANGFWTFSLLSAFSGAGGSWDQLAISSDANLYGTTHGDGSNGWGSVFLLSPSSGGWDQTILYNFTGGTDGGQPFGNVVRDANGNLFGTAYNKGSNGFGVVFQITP